jgi:hypothetical protein
MTETDLLTPLEYARYRRCSVRTLDRERADGVGCPYIRLGSRILYRRADIDRYLDAHVRAGENRVGKPTTLPGSATRNTTAGTVSAEPPRDQRRRSGDRVASEVAP